MTTPTGPAADGAALLAQLHTALTRYVILPSAEAATAVALWIAATHAQASWAHAPRLVIRAPEKRCGKSRLLDIVEGTCHAPLITVNASPAAVYRAIGSDPAHPAGRRGRHHLRRQERRGERGPAGPAERRAPAEPARDPLGQRRPPPGNHPHLRHGRPRGYRRDARHDRRPRRRHPDAPPRAGRIRRTVPAPPRPARPHHPCRRAGAVARCAPARARARRAGNAAGGPGRRHLGTAHRRGGPRGGGVARPGPARCRTAFGDADALPTTTLVTRLRSDPEAPWSDHGPAGITPMRLAAMLRDYDIRSANIRFPEPFGQVKGYYRADFTDAWARYCPSDQGEPSQPSQASPPSSTPGRPETWDGSGRPSGKAVPGLTCDGTAGTTGTATPRFGVINGGGGAA